MSTITSEQLIQQLQWRYATKQFDPARKISAENWATLEEALVLSPSSYGLQPWRFVVVTDAATKEKLRPHSWGQAQVTDCSHHVVFAASITVDEAYVDHFLARTAEVRGGDVASLAAYRGFIVSDIVQGPRSKWVHEWAARQAYIALGNFMTSAALLGIDTCPMEGLDPAKYDEVLGLPAQGYKTVVACPAGYRLATDKYASLPKVRFEHADVVAHV